MALTRNCSVYNEIDNFEASVVSVRRDKAVRLTGTGTENSAYFIGNRTNAKQLDPRRTQH